MIDRDLLVGVIAVGVGLVIGCSAVVNSQWCFQLSGISWLDNRFGRPTAKSVLFAVGGTICCLGLVVLNGSSFDRWSKLRKRDGIEENHSFGQTQPVYSKN